MSPSQPEGDTYLMEGIAETYPEPIDTAGLLEADIEAEGDELRIVLTDFVDNRVSFDDAVDAHETSEFRDAWSEVEQALEERREDEFDLTEGDNMLRGFGGGMMTVVEAEDSIKLYGPRRDFGASSKGMLDISAGRSATGDELENWLERAQEEFKFEDDILEKYSGDEQIEEEEDWRSLLLREGAEELVFTQQNEQGENVLFVPEYGDEKTDSIVHRAVLQEFLKAKNGAAGFATDERSHLSDEDFTVQTYEASAEAPENAAEIVLEDFRGEDYRFEAGVIPEFTSSSLEGVLLNVVDEEQLPDEYVPQDTETVDIGDDNVHLDRAAYEIEIDKSGVSINLYEGGELQQELGVDEYVEMMDDEFEQYLASVMEDLDSYDSEDLMDEVGEEYGSSFATVKVLEALEALEERAPEYGDQIQSAYDQLSQSAGARQELPWTSADTGSAAS